MKKYMMWICTIMMWICTIMMLFIFSANAFAQETPKAKKMEGKTWHQVVMVKFKPGMSGEAMKVIQNHFVKAGEKSGGAGPSMMMEMRSGDWDMMLVWDMKDISDMNWEVSPEDEKWWKAMAEQEGSAENAMKVWQNYMGMIEDTNSYLATSSKN